MIEEDLIKRSHGRSLTHISDLYDMLQQQYIEGVKVATVIAPAYFLIATLNSLRQVKFNVSHVGDTQVADISLKGMLIHLLKAAK